MKISLDHDRLFEPSKSTFFFSYKNFQIKETGRKYKMATWQYQTKSLQPLSRWTQVITRDLCLQLIFNDCRRTNSFWIRWSGRLREWSITKPGTVIFLFRSGNINLSGVTLSFQQLERHKISLLYRPVTRILYGGGGGGANETKVNQTTEMYILLSDPFI